MEFIEQYMIWVWLAVFIITVATEAGTQDFVSIWFSVGSLIAMAICYFAPFYVEIIVFAVISLASLILTRPLVKKFMDRTTRYTNADEFVGKKTILEKSNDSKEVSETLTEIIEAANVLSKEESKKAFYDASVVIMTENLRGAR